ncbi:MAG: hypothetical protein M1831_002501 [Alyxoria varia]|nr:MAG: hypothetical protein M1831_002501 [Alyxoria varia]
MASFKTYISRSNKAAYIGIHPTKQRDGSSRSSISSDALDDVKSIKTRPRYQQKLEDVLGRFQGWRGVTLAGAVISGVVLVANIAVTVWAVAARGHQYDGQGSYVIDDRSCDTSQRVSTGWHILINILSTLLLSASNAGMQILAAPDRSEVDKAHSQGSWLNIGTIYNDIGAFEYSVLLVDNSFVNGSPWTQTNRTLIELGQSDQYDGVKKPHIEHVQTTILDRSEFDHLDLEDCVRTFSAPWVTVYDTLVLVATPQKENSTDGPLLATGFADGLTTSECSWVCPKTDYGDAATIVYDDKDSVVDRFSEYGWRVHYCSHCQDIDYDDLVDSRPAELGRRFVQDCYARKAEQKCRVLFSLPIAIVVIVCNFAKLATFLWCLTMGIRRPLVTVGDAISTFWQNPDKTTASQPLIAFSEVRRRQWEYVRDAFVAPAASLKRLENRLSYARTQTWNGASEAHYSYIEFLESQVKIAERQMSNQNTIGKRWNPPKAPRRWFAAASWHQWTLAGFCSLAIVISCTIFYVCNSAAGGSGAAGIKKERSLGKPNLDFSIDKYSGLIYQVILANLTQLAISCTYLQFNNLFTTMLLTYEYSNYAKQRKGLRVSEKHGEQRSTYCEFPIAKFAFCTLVSESLFVISISTYDINGVPAQNGETKFSGRSPNEPIDAIYKRVKYGEVEGDTTYGGRRRAAFSSGRVKPLVERKWYDARPDMDDDAGSDSEVIYERPRKGTMYTYLDSQSGVVCR